MKLLGILCLLIGFGFAQTLQRVHHAADTTLPIVYADSVTILIPIQNADGTTGYQKARISHEQLQRLSTNAREEDLKGILRKD